MTAFNINDNDLGGVNDYYYGIRAFSSIVYNNISKNVPKSKMFFYISEAFFSIHKSYIYIYIPICAIKYKGIFVFSLTCKAKNFISEQKIHVCIRMFDTND